MMSATSIIVCGLLAITATVLAFIFIVPEKKRASLNKFGKFLHDALNFKFLIVEKILQALYILATSYAIIQGFFLLFTVQSYGGYYYSYSRWYGLEGLALMILGPIVIRLAYEGIMMFILLIKNVIQINNKIKGDADSDKKDVFAAPNFTPAAPTQEAAPTFCTCCGSKVEGNTAFCTNCGTRLQ